MKAKRLGWFWPYKDGENSTVQSTPRNHCKYSTVWVSDSCLEPSESSTHRHQQKYKPQWQTLFAQKHYVKFNEKQHPAWGWFSEIYPFSLIRATIFTLNTWLHWKLSSPRQDWMIKLHHVLHLGAEGNREEFWKQENIYILLIQTPKDE